MDVITFPCPTLRIGLASFIYQKISHADEIQHQQQDSAYRYPDSLFFNIELHKHIWWLKWRLW